MNPNNNNFRSNNGSNGKMPKFNMGWIYGLAIIGLIIALPLTTILIAYYQRYITKDKQPQLADAGEKGEKKAE